MNNYQVPLYLIHSYPTTIASRFVSRGFKQGGNKGFKELLIATTFWPPVGGIRRQLIGISNSCIKEEVEEGFPGTAVDLKGGIIRSHLVSSINAIHKVIVYINKL